MAHYKGAASEAGRAMQLMKKREQQIQDIEIRKKRIEEDLKLNNIENKFATHYDAVEQQLKVTNYLFISITLILKKHQSSTIGLVTLNEMKAKQENIVKEREKKLAQKQAEKERERQRQMEAKQAEKNKQKRQVSCGNIFICFY